MSSSFASTKSYSHRIRFAVFAMIVLLVVLAGRLVFVQAVDAAGHAQQAMERRLRPVELPAERGSILDRNDQVLAESVQRYNFVADQRLVKDYAVWDNDKGKQVEKDIDDQLEKLAGILEMDVSELRDLMIGERPYRVVTRNVTPEVRDKAEELKIPGLIAEPVAQRSYPNGAVAGSILGFVGQEGHGLEGMEMTQEEHLAGTNGQREFEVSADGVRIPNASFSEEPAVDGQDVRLTIDQDVSWYAQEAIAKKVDQYNAKWGNIVVQDAKTGDILAMADSTTVDPSNPEDTDNLFWRPTALTQAYEPGSTGKVVTFAMALNEGTIKPTTAFEVPNHQDFEGETIHDSMPHATYEMTAAGIMARSYNTGTVQIATKMSSEERYNYMKKFGIGEPIDVGLPGANKGQFANWESWDRRQQFTTTFGQGYSLTSLHTSRIFQAVANGGKMSQPRLIDAYIDPDGTEHEYETEDPVQVIDKDAADEMLKFMEGVVQNGTGTAAQIPGYRVGGKSGTGQAAGEEGGYDGHTTSFTAVAPLDDPRFVVSVAVHRPSGDWKTWKVTDTAGDVMNYLLTKYSVPQSPTGPQDYDVFVDDPQERPW